MQRPLFDFSQYWVVSAEKPLAYIACSLRTVGIVTLALPVPSHRWLPWRGGQALGEALGLEIASYYRR